MRIRALRATRTAVRILAPRLPRSVSNVYVPWEWPASGDPGNTAVGRFSRFNHGPSNGARSGSTRRDVRSRSLRPHRRWPRSRIHYNVSCTQAQHPAVAVITALRLEYIQALSRVCSGRGWSKGARAVIAKLGFAAAVHRMSPVLAEPGLPPKTAPPGNLSRTAGSYSGMNMSAF